MSSHRLPAWVIPLLLSAAFSQAALHLSRPLMSYRIVGLGGGALAVGLVTAAFAALPLFVAIPLGRLTDRLRRLGGLLALGTLLMAVGALVMSTTETMVGLAVSSAVLGLGQLVLMLSCQATIARWLPDDQLDRGFGWLTAAAALGQLIGPLIAGLLLGHASGSELAEASRTAFWWAAGIAALPLLSIGVIAAHEPTRQRDTVRRVAEPIESTWQLIRRPQVGPSIYASLALLATVDVVTAYLPLIGAKAGISPVLVGVLLALRSTATIFSRVLLGTILRRWTRRQVILASLIGSSLVLAVVPIAGIGVAGMGAALLMGGFLLGMGQPITMSVLARAVPNNARSSVLALRLTGNRLGQVAVPSGAGLVATLTGAPGAWWLTCAVLATAATVAAGASPER